MPQPSDFVWLDVFTDRPLGGNPLPVVFDPGERLTAEQMLAIAAEFRASESTFVVPPRDRRAAWRLRSFSTTAEVFGAGHNALGAWWAIAARGLIECPDGETEAWQELGDRILPLTITREGGRLRRIAMRQAAPETTAGAPPRAALADALSLDAAALEVAGLEPEVVSTGARHLLVPARGLADLRRVVVDPDRLLALARPLGCHGCYLFCLETTSRDAVARARAFGPGIGIAEDPATGSAAGPLAAYLAARGRLRQGEWTIVEQGCEMGRPSRIEVRVSGDRVEVAGECVVVADGRLMV